jgi:UDP-N-acetyl-2-amino-2-deoxyglucuronate dehydrogenase
MDTIGHHTLSVAVVGCGSIGKRHAAVLDADSDTRLVAVCDINLAAAETVAGHYGGVAVYTDFHEMIEVERPDMVVVATPHALHADIAVASLLARCHVLVEKPMALNSHDCRRMMEAASQSGKKLWVVKQNRHNIPVRLTDEAIRAGKLGKIFMVKCDILWNRYQGYYDDSAWRGSIEQEGGALFTQASHFIDLLIWWCGDITEAKARIETMNHSIETEDTGAAVLKFSSGTLGSLVWTTCVHERNLEGSITIVGELGTIVIGGEYLNKIEFWNVKDYPLPEGVEFVDRPNSYGKYQGTSSNHDKVLRSIIGYLKGISEETVEGWEGLRSVEAIEIIYASARQ